MPARHWRKHRRRLPGAIAELSVHQFELEMLRKAQVTLVESRDRYLNLYEFAPIGYLMLTQDAIVSEVNFTGANMLGVERKELLNHRFSQIVAPEDRECWHRHFILALKHIEWQSCELLLQRGDGSRFFARLDCRHMEVGGESSVHIALSNITERRQSEIALKESELRFRMLFRTAGDGLHIMDVYGNLLQASDSFCRMLGYSQDEILGMNVLQWDALLPSDTRFEEKVNSIPEEGLVLETRHRCKDGHAIDVEIYCTAVSIQGEKFVYASSRDITERKRIEAERLAHIRFFESMDRVNRVIQGAKDIEQMMSEALDVVFSIFDCDRVFLMYPCDPEATSWRVPMECTRPEYPGVRDLGLVMPMDEEVAKIQRILLDADAPVKFGPGTGHPLAEHLGVKCFMSMALHPKEGKPWNFGLHQCSYARVWTADEERLFQEIGRRLTDGLSSLLAYRNLRTSEQKFRTLVESIPNLIVRYDSDLRRIYVNPAWEEASNLSAEEVVNVAAADTPRVPQPVVNEYLKKLQKVLQTGTNQAIEFAWVNARGETLYLDYVIVPEFDPDGKIVSVLAVGNDITERKHMEKMLVAREREFRTLAENAPDNIARYDREGRIVYVNPQLETTLGISAAELLGKTPNETCPDGGYDNLEVAIRRVIDTAQNADYYFALPDTGEGERYHHLRITPERNEHGKVDGVLAIGRDITESKRALRALQSEIEKSRAILRNASDGIHILDADANIVEVSDSFCSMLGYRREEMIGMNVSQWDGELPYGERLKIIRRRIAQKSRNQFDTRHRRNDGTIFDVEISSFPLELDGKPVLFCSSRDISERKENELIQCQLSEQLRQYTDTISDLYDHAPCGYHSLDKDGKFLHINETELNWLGYARYEIVGKKGLVDLLTPDSIPIFQQTFSHFKEVGEEHDFELSLVRKDGTKLPVLISSSAVYDADGTYIMGRSTVYDMTERIKMEQERIDYLKRMEEASRHLVTTQENTRRYLSSELHDRTSPNLAAISINLDIIAAEMTQEHLLDLAERLEDTRALIVDTTESIREFVADMRPPLLDYAGLAAAIESHVQQFTRRTGIRLKFDCINCEERFNPELESLLFRIFQEALTNCAKHSHAKFVKATLSNAAYLIRLAITDDGVGFDPAQLGRGVRIGLGLLNMRELAEVAGGKIVIDSVPGKGTSIAVEISLH